MKAQIRRRQREMANARMMERVKDADVVITNPSTLRSPWNTIRPATAHRSWWPKGQTTWRR